MLLGRRSERIRLDGVLADARASRSQVLVLRGDPGVGKSALLSWAAERAGSARCLRAAGVQSELELPFAVLQQLLAPVTDRLDALPLVQADALRGALGLGPGRGSDRFLVGVGLLSLLGEVAADSGAVCLVDDAQWADSASVEALVFAARRLEAEGAGLILATRATGRDAFVAAGLPELVLNGLDPEAAAALIAERAPTATEDVRRRLVAGTGGNPLALVEVPSVMSAAQLTGLEPLPDPLPVGGGVERVFAALVARLPGITRRLLLLAAADDTGRLGVVSRAAAAEGLELAAFGPAEASGLVRIVGERVEFRHPLVRSAVYQDAGFTDRRAAHHCLAAVLDGAEDLDRRAWHLAAGAVSPDDAVADLLEASAERARTRSGPAAAAAALSRSATLTGRSDIRGLRLVAAAEASWNAGHPTRAVQLLDDAEPFLRAPEQRAGLSGLRGLIELSGGSPETAYPLLVTAALEAPDRSSALARLALAGEAASLAGGQRAVELGRLVQQVVPGDAGEDGPVVDLLLGTAEVAAGDWTAGAARLRRVTSAARRTEDPLVLLRAGQAGLLLGDEVAARRCYLGAEAVLRRTGALGLLATTLNRLAFSYAQSGLLGDAERTCQEGVRLARELGQQSATADVVLALVAAWRGDEETCRRHAVGAVEEAEARRLGAVRAGAGWALGLLELGLGRPDQALARLGPVVAGRGLSHAAVALWATPDLVEAAARAGRPEDGRDALQRFGGWARRAGTPWGIALAHRGAAQLAGGDLASFEEALDSHEAATRPLDEARTRLAYGETLRRLRRRVDARLALRPAAEAFDRAGALPWAERARAELRATGETFGRRAVTEWDRLTPQELEIARLAAGGSSNPEIATRLFLSRKTVEFHLHKVFTKLGVGGRTELARIAQD
ncbi:ATP-binding protein [Geodermatophilus maliterrae]|uniref:LuxR C-terminal-related transcriptional regulator n=1 Tax=Geodermatophilus maliterrae TaxID=3162531 RepID=A0ABV3XDL7_9ACTN